MNHLTPAEAAEKRIKLSEEYSRLSDEMGLLEQKEAVFFHEKREGYKTDKAAQIAYNASQEGQRLIYLKRHCKGREKEISALNSFISVANHQVLGHY